MKCKIEMTISFASGVKEEVTAAGTMMTGVAMFYKTKLSTRATIQICSRDELGKRGKQ